MSTISTTTTTYSTSVPFSIAVAANGYAYGVNGVNRGFRYDGGTVVSAIGITAAPAITASTSASPLYGYVTSIDVNEPSRWYYETPTVSIDGIAGARAIVRGGGVASIAFTTSATTHVAAPAVNISGGLPSGASMKAILRGGVSGVKLTGDHYYGSINAGMAMIAGVGLVDYQAATFSINSSCGSAVTEIRKAKGRGAVTYAPAGGESGLWAPYRLTGIVITDPGEYEVDASAIPDGVAPVICSLPPVPIYLAANFISGTLYPTDQAVYSGSIYAVTATSGGASYIQPPDVAVVPKGPSRAGGGAVVQAAISGGSLTGGTVVSSGAGYDGAVTLALSTPGAEAVATITPRMAGKYLCAIRFVDSTPDLAGGPVAGNFGEFLEVDCDSGASAITWNLSGVSVPEPDVARVTHVELWRTTADQAITLYRVAKFAIGSVPSSFSDSLTDDVLVDDSRKASGSFAAYDALPILTEAGYPVANRRGIPPSRFSVICMHQDRAWYAADRSGQTPNTIFFSEIDEPESVPEEYQVTIQQVGRESDRIVSLLTMDSSLYVLQRRRIHRLTVSGNPLEGASASSVAQRGALNDKCWDIFEGVAYIADSFGVYVFDGSSANELSGQVSNYWTDIVDFSKSEWFFVRVAPADRIVRFYFIPIGSSATYPSQALCYSLVTKAWWREEYAHEMSCSAVTDSSGPQRVLLGSGGGVVYKEASGQTDAGEPIAYKIKTGNLPLSDDPRRGLRLTYSQAATSGSTIGAAFYYNGSTEARPTVIDSRTGDKFSSIAGSTVSVVDLGEQSSLSANNGYAQLYMAGRIDDRSKSGDRNVAVELSGVRSGGEVVLHRLDIEGVG